LTANYNNYSAAELEKALQSWVEPYPKPIILNHDLNSEPIGRVMAAKMDKEQDGSSYVRLQIAITDPTAIQKILDKRYLTGSVGGKAGKALCSISGDDLASESADGKPKFPKYKRGQVYKGKLAYIDMQDISFKEYSFVNQPADGKSGVRKSSSGDVQLQNASDGWVARSSAFVLNMDEEDIFSIEENKSILKNLKRKESKPLYLHLKGAFLTAMAIQESETYKGDSSSLLFNKENKDNEESLNMKENPQEDNVLAVVESLEQDLSATKVVSDEKTEVQAENLEVSQEIVESKVEENKQESTTEENQVSNDNSEKADEQSVEVVDSEKAEEPKEKSEETQIEAQEQPKEEASLNSEEKVATETEQSELLERVKALEEENAKLKKALHNTLVERVVDAKITVGLESAESRESAIEDHRNRSASSLADSLRDLAKMPKHKNAKVEMPEITSETEVVEGEKNVITLDDEGKEEKADEKISAEQLFVDTLMGRRKL
jgi:hypothetical protein